MSCDFTLPLPSPAPTKSSLGATYSHGERSDPNIVPSRVVGYDGDPGVRPWEELVEVAKLP